MRIALTEAGGRLAELVQRVETGDEVVITRDDAPVVRLVAVPVVAPRDPETLRAIITEIQASAAAEMTFGPCAARSQDFLYDDDGLPG